VEQFKDLMTKGWCVVRNVFDADLLNTIAQDYNLIKGEHGFMQNYEIACPGGKKIPYLDRVDQALATVYKQIQEQTGITTDFTQTPAYFAIERGTDTKWHQDHESYFQTGDHKDYLNIWVPIIKPDAALSNLGVINFEKLFELDPNAKFLQGLGATRFFVKNGVTMLHNENDDSTYTIPFDINTIADYPELNAGDAIIIRGDCIHQTQDRLTQRVSLSIRRLNSQSKIKRSHYDITSNTKRHIFESNPQFAQQMAIKFKDTDEITIAQFFDMK
jgi:ectoine hydroxylase-related dioxygenase (phytanoyl-CoA dioxygenase family)